MEHHTMSIDAFNQLNEAHADQPLDLDLFTLIASAERVLPDKSIGHVVFSGDAVEVEPISVTLPQLVSLYFSDPEVDSDDFIIDRATEAYARVLHRASLKCHFNDPKVTPWEYAELEIETIGEWLLRTKQPTDVCVPLKGDS